MLRSILAVSLLCAAGLAAAQSAPPAAAEAPLPPLRMVDQRVGTGAEALPGTMVGVYYTGWLLDPSAPNQRGRQFDTSLGKPPFVFALGARKVIRGWDQGVEGMKVGGKRTLLIPSHLAYGKRGAGGGVIPPDADLVFDVELVDVQALEAAASPVK